MTNTDFVYRDDLRPRAVTGSHPPFHFFMPLLVLIHRDGFANWAGAVQHRRMWLVPLYTDYTAPTGLIGTGRDLARFGQAIVSGGALDGVRILKAEAAATMLKEGFGPNSGPDRDRMGLGWHWWNEAPIAFLGHGGEGPGFMWLCHFAQPPWGAQSTAARFRRFVDAVGAVPAAFGGPP